MFAFIFFSLIAAGALRRPLLADKSAVGATMEVDKIVGQPRARSIRPLQADKSAVGTINRPLRLSDKGEATRSDGMPQLTLVGWERWLSREALSIGLIV